MKNAASISLIFLSSLGITACQSTPYEPVDVTPSSSDHSKLAGTAWWWPSQGSSGPYISFLANGHIQGSTGCNAISGVYEETSDIKHGKHLFRLGDIITTEKACPDIMEIEATFLNALRLMTSYNLSSDQMMVYDENGGLIIRMDRKRDKRPER